MYHITPTQWALVDPICKSAGHDGRVFFLEHNEGITTPVEVSIEDNPMPPDVPAHYKDLWPLDPRD